MNTYCGKKIFSNELYEYLDIPKKPYYLNFIYDAFFNKIKDSKSWNSYKLNDTVKKILHIEWGAYTKMSAIKRMIKEHHVISKQIPDGIICYKQDTSGIVVNQICI